MEKPTEAQQQKKIQPIEFTFRVYRDCDVWRLRKVVVQLHHASMNPLPLDRTRMFAGPWFLKRLGKRMQRMANRASKMVLASQYVARVETK